MGLEYLKRSVGHDASHLAKAVGWKFAVDNAEALSKLLAKARARKKKAPNYETLRRTAEASLPPIQILEAKRRKTGDQTVFRRVGTVVKNNKYTRRDEESLFLEASVNVSTRSLANCMQIGWQLHIPYFLSRQMVEVVKFHRGLHDIPDSETLEVNLGIDGVQECNSTQRSLNIFACQFRGCRNVYPLIIQRPTRLVKSAFGKREGKRALAELVKAFKVDK